MKLIYVDDEVWMRKRFEMECEGMEDVDLCGCFEHAQDAIDYVRAHDIQCAFLDVEMPEMSGLELADKLQKVRPGIVTIFLSAHEQYMIEAFKNREADYYLLKPYTAEQLNDAIRRAKLLTARQKKRVYVETFGNFTVYLDGEFLRFKSKAAKELFAYLVDNRGTTVSNKDMFYAIYEDLPYSHENMTRIRKGLQKLRMTLSEAGISDILISQRGDHRLDTSLFDCDYYQFMDGDIDAIRKYQGKYMTEYFWAEVTNAMLYEKSQNYNL